MSRNNIYSIVASLLCLISVTIQAQTLTRYEYWFDDDFANRESGGISGSESVVNTSIETEGLTNGIHKINFRAQQSDGKYSAVTTSFFFKLNGGEATHLEYWVDNDIAHSKIIEGKLASDGKDYIFVSDLDLGNISPGHHRLYCRAISGSKRTVSAVTTTPVMVKLREYGDETVVKYSVAIDDDTPTVYNVKDPRSIVTIPHTLDARGLREGKEHRIDMKFYVVRYGVELKVDVSFIFTSA